jgi:phosphoglycolate phosphatase
MRTDGFVIFDLDGTLFDTRGDIARAVNAGLAAQGQPTADEGLIVSFVGDGVGRLVDRTLAAVGGAADLAPRVAGDLLAFYRLHPADRTRPYPGVAEALDTLRDVPLAVASNKPTDLCQTILAAFGWTRRFEAVLGADWGGPRKPDPAVLMELARLLHRPAAAGVMVGDSTMDLRAGRAAGMRTVAALYGFRPAAELQAAAPDASASRPEDLGAVLAGLLGLAPGRQ